MSRGHTQPPLAPLLYCPRPDVNDSPSPGPPAINPHPPRQTVQSPSTDEFVDGIRRGDRALLSRAITRTESTLPEHQTQAQEIIDRCLPATGDSLRIGITGPPGVGKSTFIEALGVRLVDEGYRLAVLATDPSSERSRGSILGDKTRMNRLANREGAYVRPSPSGGTLGGVAQATREAVLLCEAAGFDLVLLETVGVGQSETTMRLLVDIFVLLMPPGAGDEIQGMKRGILEMADLLVLNKADRLDASRLDEVRAMYESALRLFPPRTPGWPPQVQAVSALQQTGLDEVWDTLKQYADHLRAEGILDERRRAQTRQWMHESLKHQLLEDFFSNPHMQQAVDELEGEVTAGRLSPFTAARQLLARYQSADSR